MPGHLRRRRGFTLIEAALATALVGLAGSALLLGVSSSLQTTYDVVDQSIALGLAQTLMDELAGKPYFSAGGSAYDYPIGPTAAEQAGTGRQLYNSIGDYNGLNVVPNDDWGTTLGTENGSGGARHANFQVPSGFFSRWKQQVSVYYVSASNPSVALSSGQTSDFRAVEVKVFLTDAAGTSRQMASLRRVFSYVPTP